MSDAKVELSKLEEQATGKAELSYSYWAANAAKDAPPPEAKKLTEAEAAVAKENLQRAASSGASAWNAAGTFEDRDLTNWVKDVVKDLLVGVQSSQPSSNNLIAKITEVESCSGDAGQWIVRGSVRANFDLDIKVKWVSEVDGSEISGTARIPNAAWDELDDLLLEVEGDHDGGKAAAKLLLPQIKCKLEELIEKIKAYGT